MPSVFTRILNGEQTARFIYQDDLTAAVVSDTPVKPGHCIVFTREEIPNWFELPPALMNHLMAVAQRVGRAISTAYQPKRVGVAIIGIVVPHVHIHLIPVNEVAELDLTKQNQNASAESLDEAATRLRVALGE